MLKLKYLFENYDLARVALNNWNYDESETDNMLKKFRISSNAIYPFCQQESVCFLRLAPSDEKLEQNILGEMEFITYLVEKGFPSLRPLKTKSGELFLRIPTQWGEYFATAFKAVKGTQIEKTDYSNTIMFEYGKALGRLHALSSDFVPKIRKWSHIDVLLWIQTALQEYNAKNYVFTELAAVTTELEKLPICNNNYGLVHYDFEPDNVFYDSDANLCAVIDFDDSMYHWYALDIAQVFDSLSSELNGEVLDAAKAEFIKGYHIERNYDNEIKNALPLMQRFINLYTYARLIRCVEEKFDNEPDWLITLRKKLANIIKAKELEIIKIQE